MKSQGQGGKGNVMMASVVTLGILLFTSLIVMFIYINKSGKLSDNYHDVKNRLSVLEDEYSQVSNENTANIAGMDSLNTVVSQMDSTHSEELKQRDNRISYLASSGNKKVQALQSEIDRLVRVEIDHEKLQNRYDKLLAETLRKRDQIKSMENDINVLKDSINYSRDLFAYNISPLTKWNRWLCADRYNVNVARRVNEINVTFEIAGTPFSIPGKRNVYLNLLDPDGNIMYPQGESFLYTQMQKIDYNGDYIPVEFTIENPVKLDPGQYTFQVFIDGQLIRESQMIFN